MSTDPMSLQARQMLRCRCDALRGQELSARSAPSGSGARFSSKERLELAEVEAALVRIDEDRFGGCEDCGGAIGRQRLLAVPEARYCLGCADRRRGLEAGR
ncbi:TraR/DksA family transcriptional regulator [Corallococcus sp. ZKHCc1 1396]|uniref:TraR/DksA family transcriptional regulator n=1 Tax=Corallococcus soli TaxID=2710757 RepID=A0ABR9PJU2_9BACT|nr:TraR/DksA C4-type zinc finger protein [Corallococcus soli]MBE4748170.1 TraR/DksA family transcriptional regulator [Corallococcus soli]